jgi:arylsulfatase A-like enzyme
MRVPMIIRYPRMFSAGKVVDKMALNIDIAPTLLNLAGVSIPSQMQGRSLTPLMTGQSTSWRNSFLYEYFEEVRYEPPKAPPNILAVRTDTAKLIKWPGHPEWTELYNLKTDPYEMRNLYNVSSAATLKQQMLTIFDQQMAATQFKVPSGADYPFSLNGLIGG